MNELVSSVHRENQNNTPWNKSLAEGCKSVANTADTTRRMTNVTEAVCKVAIAILKFIPGTELAIASMEVLKGKCCIAKSIFNGTSIFERGFEWSDKTRREDILLRWEKTAHRVFMTAANFLDTVLLVDKLSIGFFAQEALCFCKIPIFEMVKNGFVFAFSLFGLCSAGKDLVEASKSTDKAYTKGNKWLQRQIEFSKNLTKFNGEERAKAVARYKSKIVAEEALDGGGNADKIDNWKYYVAALSEDVTEENLSDRVEDFQEKKRERILAKNIRNLNIAKTGACRIQELEEKINYSNIRLKYVEKDETKNLLEQIKANKEELAALKGPNKEVSVKIKPREQYIKALREKKIDGIIEYKTMKYATRIDNDNNKRTKSWISIGADIGKIAMVILGIATEILALLVFPSLTGPCAILILTGLGFISSSLGLVKPLYSLMGPQKVNEPQFIYV